MTCPFDVEETPSGLLVSGSDRKHVSHLLETETEGLLTVNTPNEDILRIATASRSPDSTGHELSGGNAVYYDAEVTERPLTESESDWCETTFRYDGDDKPETITEVRLPPVDELEEAIFTGDLDAYNGLSATITDKDERDRIVKSLQERIEEEQFRAKKLHPRKGLAIEMLPEWDPSEASKNRETLYEMASMRADAHQTDWREVIGFSYYHMFKRRTEMLGFSWRFVEPYELVALDVASAEDWKHCRRCAKVAPEEQLLEVNRRNTKKQDIICDSCAERADEYEQDAVDSAKDKRARNLGGQRRLEGFDDGN